MHFYSFFMSECKIFYTNLPAIGIPEIFAKITPISDGHLR